MKALLPFLKTAARTLLLMLFFAFGQKSFGQAASATWNPSSSGSSTVTPTIVGNVTAGSFTSANLGAGVTSPFTNNSTYGIGGQSWSTSSSTPAATTTHYIQFQVAPVSGNNLNITSVGFVIASSLNNDNDRMVIYYSTDNTFSTGVNTLASGVVINTNPTQTYSTATNITVNSGNTLYFRVIFYFAFNGSETFGLKSGITISGSTTSLASVTTGTITGSPFCVTSSSTASVSVPFTSSGTFTSNTYTAQLSNSAGSFASPVTLGTLSSNANSGTISGTIPASTATGSGYLIRVISSSPSVTGSNSSAITINYAANSITPATTQNINASTNGTALAVTEQSTASSRQWYYATVSGGPYSNSISGATGATYTPNFAAQGTYYVVCVSTFACGSITSNQVQVNVSATVTTGTITGSPFCVTPSSGASINIPFTSAGSFTSNTYTAQLSSAAGSFASPVTLGTLSSNANSGTISGTIPVSTATGSGYLIRVISSNPSITGSNSSAITINYAANNIAPTANQNINTSTNGTTLAVTEQSTASSRQWYYGTVSGGPYGNAISGATGTSYIPNFASAGTYYVVCKSVFACATITSNEVQIVVVLPAITTGTISGSPFCVTASAGAAVSVPFTSAGNYSSNTYTAQLSSASGSFASPTSIGTLVSNSNSGTINATIPAATATGTGYLIRVISSSPSVTGTSSSAITINYAANSVAPSGNQSYAAGAGGTALSVTEQSTASSRQWYYGTVSGGPYNTLINGETGSSFTPNFTTSGTYYVVCKSTFTCGTATSNQVQVTVNPGALSVLTMSAISSPQPVDASITPSVTITGKDAYGNLVNGGSINMTTTAGSITPASVTLSSSGTVTVSNFVVTVSGANQTITATSAANSSVFVVSNTFTVSAFASSASDYFRSNASADWATTSTWQGSHDGTNWYNTVTAYPTSSATSIAIQTGHTITVTSAVSGAAITVASGAIININSGGTLSVANGSGTDLTISGVVNINNNGTLANSGTISSTGSTLLVNSGGVYQHTQNGGAIPVANWNISSTCYITGVTNSAPSGLTASFGNFKWNSTGQVFVDDGFGVGVDKGVALGTVTVNGNFTLNSTGSSLINISSLTVKGTYTQTGGMLVDFSNSTTGNTTATLNVAGDFNMSGGILGTSSGLNNATLTVNFNGTSTQKFIKSGGSISTDNQFFAGTMTNNFNVNSGAIVDFSTYVLNGTANFTLSSTGGVITANTSGLAASGATGSIQVSGTRSFNSGANYTYNGTSAQVTGTGLPATLTGSLTINNSTGVSLSQATAINSPGKLLLAVGNFTLSSGLTFNNGSAIVRDAGSLSAAPTFNATVNVSYSSLGINTLTQTTGFELPASTTALGNLTINKTGANITLGASATVNGVLSLTDGLITTSSTSLLKISSTGSVTLANSAYNNTSYVNGPVQRTGTGSFTFPVGKSGTGYTPIGVNPTSSQTFTAEYFRSSALSIGSTFVSGTSLKNISTCDYWRLDLGTTYPSSTNSTLSSGTASVTLYWNQNNPCGGHPYVTDPSTLAIAHYNFGNGWDQIGLGSYTRTGDATSGSITYVGATTFSPFAIGSLSSTGNPLPIILDYFTATKASGYNKLTWKAECTSSSSGFDVERSYNGTDFSVIHTVTVSSSADCSLPFNYNDYNSKGDKIYYRIKMVDLDGNATYSNIELISNVSNTFELMSVQPNPVFGNANLKIAASGTQNIELMILGIDGKELQRKTVQVQNGTNSISLNTAMLSKGVYFVKGIFANGQTNTIKFIKQ